MIKYTHSLANYPTSFLGIAISKNRFCLQFQDVTVKLRQDIRDPEQGLLKLPSTEKALPIVSNGSEINVLAVRCTEDVILDVQKELLRQYKAYLEVFPDSELRNKLSEIGITC